MNPPACEWGPRQGCIGLLGEAINLCLLADSERPGQFGKYVDARALPQEEERNSPKPNEWQIEK